MQDYFISFMTVEDLNKIKNILQSDFDEFWDYDVLYNELISANSKYIVAKTKDNIIVAFAGIKIILDTAEIMNIVTKKSMRNLGIGSYMLENLISICKKNNIKLLNLEVKNTNSIAINFYKKYNFKEVGLRKKYYDNGDALLFTKFI